MPKYVWLRVEPEEYDAGFLALAVDKNGEEITHDRAASPHTALGMVTHTLARAYNQFVVVGFEWLGLEYHKEKI